MMNLFVLCQSAEGTYRFPRELDTGFRISASTIDYRLSFTVMILIFLLTDSGLRYYIARPTSNWRPGGSCMPRRQGCLVQKPQCVAPSARQQIVVTLLSAYALVRNLYVAVRSVTPFCKSITINQRMKIKAHILGLAGNLSH